MDPKDFTSTIAGELVPITGGGWAFVPSPLPPPIAYTSELSLVLSQADAALSELSGLGRYLPNPDLLITPYLRREAVASSRIEGTEADVADLMLDEVAPGRTPPQSDVREVRNYLRALQVGMDRSPSIPLGGPIILSMHQALMEGVRGGDRTPGSYRTVQNWIGSGYSTPATATYVPPPPDERMHQCLRRWEIFVNDPPAMPDLILCALMHEHFEAIHPFRDGNGRIGRLLITLFLIERGRLSKPLLYLSSYIEQHKAAYYALLQSIRTSGNWTGWLTYFLTAVRDTARDAVAQSTSILAIRDAHRRRFAGDTRALILLDELFVNPYVTVRLASKRLGVSHPTATRVIERFASLNLLREAMSVSGGPRGRVWVCDPILDALQRMPPIEPL